MVAEEVELQFAGKAQAVHRLTRQHDPAYGLNNVRSGVSFSSSLNRGMHWRDRGG